MKHELSASLIRALLVVFEPEEGVKFLDDNGERHPILKPLSEAVKGKHGETKIDLDLSETEARHLSILLKTLGKCLQHESNVLISIVQFTQTGEHLQ